jgi:hypothetical protein
MSQRKHEVPQELLNSLLANYKTPEDLIGDPGGDLGRCRHTSARDHAKPGGLAGLPGEIGRLFACRSFRFLECFE